MVKPGASAPSGLIIGAPFRASKWEWPFLIILPIRAIPPGGMCGIMASLLPTPSESTTLSERKKGPATSPSSQGIPLPGNTDFIFIAAIPKKARSAIGMTCIQVSPEHPAVDSNSYLNIDEKNNASASVYSIGIRTGCFPGHDPAMGPYPGCQ